MHDRLKYELNTTLRNRSAWAQIAVSSNDHKVKQERIYSALYSHQLTVYNQVYRSQEQELREEE